MSLQQHVLARALADARAYRDLVRAALDKLHQADVNLARQQAQIAALRAELQRYTAQMVRE